MQTQFQQYQQQQALLRQGQHNVNVTFRNLERRRQADNAAAARRQEEEAEEERIKRRLYLKQQEEELRLANRTPQEVAQDEALVEAIDKAEAAAYADDDLFRKIADDYAPDPVLNESTVNLIRRSAKEEIIREAKTSQRQPGLDALVTIRGETFPYFDVCEKLIQAQCQFQGKFQSSGSNGGTLEFMLMATRKLAVNGDEAGFKKWLFSCFYQTRLIPTCSDMEKDDYFTVGGQQYNRVHDNLVVCRLSLDWEGIRELHGAEHFDSLKKLAYSPKGRKLLGDKGDEVASRRWMSLGELMSSPNSSADILAYIDVYVKGDYERKRRRSGFRRRLYRRDVIRLALQLDPKNAYAKKLLRLDARDTDNRLRLAGRIGRDDTVNGVVAPPQFTPADFLRFDNLSLLPDTTKVESFVARKSFTRFREREVNIFQKWRRGY
jgi:hypothetical protein